jgi:Flp pilus assembly protein TadB
MATEEEAGRDAAFARAAGWAGAALAALALIGLALAPSLRVLWVVLLVFAIAAVPQALATTRRQKRERASRGR